MEAVPIVMSGMHPIRISEVRLKLVFEKQNGANMLNQKVKTRLDLWNSPLISENSYRVTLS